MNEVYVTRLFNDFYLRNPTSPELTWYTTVLANGTSRAQVVGGLLAANEFGSLATFGVFQLYLERDPTSSESTLGRALVANGDYDALEALALGSAGYFSAAGGTNTGFVTALYQDIFKRPPDSSGLAYYVGQLTSGARTRSQVVQAMRLSSEAARLRVAGPAAATGCATTDLDEPQSLYVGAFCLILNRPATVAERSAWTPQLQANGNNLVSLFTSLASTDEYVALAP